MKKLAIVLLLGFFLVPQYAHAFLFDMMKAKKEMDLTHQFQAPITSVWDAILKTSEDLQIAIKEKSFDNEKEGMLVGTCGELKYIRIYLQQVTPQFTEVGIQARTAAIPWDKSGYKIDFAFEIKNKISDYLSGKKQEISGFREVKCGNTLEKLKDVLILDNEATSESKDETKYYVRKDDELKIGQAELSTIRYAFWNEKLLGIVIRANKKGVDNWILLKDTTFKKLGYPHFNKFTDEYAWKLSRTLVILNYNKISDAVGLAIWCNDVLKESQEKNRIKNKDGF